MQAVLDLDLVELSQDSVEALQLERSQVEDQLAVAVAVSAAEPPVHSVRVELAGAVKLASQSALREKNSNKEVFQALVEQLFQEEMATQSSDCAVELPFRTLQTRLMPMLVS